MSAVLRLPRRLPELVRSGSQKQPIGRDEFEPRMDTPWTAHL